MTTITVNSQDLGEVASIDTYQTYTSDGVEDMLINEYNEEHNTDYTYDDFNWEYDHETIVSELAEKRSAALESDSPAIQKCVPVASYSPKEYNYQTDSTDFEITYDENIVDEYIMEHDENYTEWYHNNWAGTIEWRDEGDDKALLRKIAHLDYYLNKTTYDYDEGAYYAIAEDAQEIYVNNIKMELIGETK